MYQKLLTDIKTKVPDAFHKVSGRVKLTVPQIILAACLLLEARVLYPPDLPENSILQILRVGFPLIVALAALILSIDKSLQGNKVYLRISSKSPVFAFVTVVLTLAAVILDLLAETLPILLLPGLLTLGFIYWNRQVLLFFGTAAITAGLGVIFFFLGRKPSVEELSLFLLSLILTELTANMIRRNVVPNQERMDSLEVENKELWSLSYRDTLTGLYNRRFMHQTAVHLFKRSIRYREYLHVLMIDIDHFKKVNDQLGHAVGDEVLKVVSDTIQTFVRSSDTVARYGGEEFIVYVVEASTELTQYIANRIRDGIAAIRFENVPWTITVSIGIASLQDGDTIESQIARADQFLYFSKRNGRNRVSGT